jgi:hypothetical protein
MNQVNGLFMSLLALIIVRQDQIFNVFCLQLHRKKCLRRQHWDLCLMKRRRAWGSISGWAWRSEGNTALPLCPITCFCVEHLIQGTFRFSYHSEGRVRLLLG